MGRIDLILAYNISRYAALSNIYFIETKIKSGYTGICPIHFVIIILGKKRDALYNRVSTFLIYVVSKVQINQDLLKINATYQFLLHTGYLRLEGTNTNKIKQ
jgi:hypothetical protein